MHSPSIKSKFENSSRILDDILSNLRPLSDKSGLGFDKEKKPEYSSFTNQGGNKRSYAAALKSPVKKEESKKYVSSFHDKDKNNEVSKRPMTNRYQQTFLGHCYSCNNFGLKALKCRAYGKIHDYKKDAYSNKPKYINHNHFGPFQRYDIECYKCTNFGHMDRECKLRKNVLVEAQKQWKKMEVGKQKDQIFLKGKFYGYCYFCHKFGHKATNCRTKGKEQDTNIEDDKGQNKKDTSWEYVE